MGASEWVAKLITYDLTLPWLSEPPPWRLPRLPLPPNVLEWSQDEVDRWCSRGFARRATAAEARRARWVSASFVVDIDTKLSLVLDYQHQNQYMESRPFRYEQMADLIMDLGPIDHLTSWDVADAFHHVCLSPKETFLLAFRVGHTVYFPLTMPFGLKQAPWVWAKLMRPVVAHMRAWGFKIMPYMDDFGCRAAVPHPTAPISQAQATTGRLTAITIFRSLGIDIHKSKGEAVGTRTLGLLGFLIDTSGCLLLLQSKRLRGVVASAVSLGRHATSHRR